MSNQAVVSGSGIECPICGGTGWELFTAYVDENDKEHEFGRLCTKCSGARRSWDNTNVPPQFYEVDLSKFRFDIYNRKMDKLEELARGFFSKFDEWQRYGKGLYLWSRTAGSGKTFLACALGRSVMLRYNLQLRFTTAPDYLSAVSESYKREHGMRDESQVFRECDLLIFDDIGSQKRGDWQQQEVYKIVNTRLNAGRITIYTSNVPPENLDLEERTINRIIGTSVVIQMPEESIRKMKAEEEQAKFLRMILAD